VLELGSRIHAIAVSVFYDTKLHIFEVRYLHSMIGCVPDKFGLLPQGKKPVCDADVCRPGMIRHKCSLSILQNVQGFLLCPVRFVIFTVPSYICHFYCAQLDCVICTVPS
jgi:hypothetical protein